MSNLGDYYKTLLRWEEQEYRQLVHEWPMDLREDIVSAFVNVVSDTSIKSSVCPIKPGSTNQSIGNQVEKFTIEKLSVAIREFTIEHCSGSGYPDKILIKKEPQLRMPLEFKATSDWNEKDSNRRVLTSSSKKLRKQFTEPIYHLLLTVLYSNGEEDLKKINNIRLDFLEPTTKVNVRLEASVNHKILANGPHHSKMI